ncbi:MAG: hypothetical protein ABJQ70_22120 [Roseobacter sp.]
MKRRTNGRYAVVALVDIALQSEVGAKGGSSGTRAQSLFNRLCESLSAQVCVYLHRVPLAEVIQNTMMPCPAIPDFFQPEDAR